MIIGIAANLKNIIRINEIRIKRYLWMFGLNCMLLNFKENNAISDTNKYDMPRLKKINTIGLESMCNISIG